MSDKSKQENVDHKDPATRVLSLISHKLKTPLSIINGYTEAILSQTKPGELSTFASKALIDINKQGEKMTVLVDKLVRFSSVSSLTSADTKKDMIKARPLFSAVASPTTPLAFESCTAGALAVLAEAGVPVTPMNVPLAGTTAPCSFAGTLVVTNAEQLATLAILKAYNPEAPMVYSADVGSADLRTGNVAYNNPDYDLYTFACAQLARFYGIPCTVGSGSYEEKDFSTKIGFNQNVLKVAINQMSMTDGACWIGSRDDCLATSWWDIVLDAEVLKYAKLYCKELEVNENTLALDVIHEVGPRGEFMSHEHTLENFRREITLTGIEDSFLFNEPGKHFIDLARQRADEILKTHAPAALDEAFVRELDDMMKAVRAEF